MFSDKHPISEPDRPARAVERHLGQVHKHAKRAGDLSPAPVVNKLC